MIYCKSATMKSKYNGNNEKKYLQCTRPTSKKSSKGHKKGRFQWDKQEEDWDESMPVLVWAKHSR